MNPLSARTASKPHAWLFARIGSVDQVVLRNGEDVRQLRHLDQKLWMALSMPTRGVAFDPVTADLLDTNHDGRIRPVELLAAVDWVCQVLKDPGDILVSRDHVPLAAIQDAGLVKGARAVLANLGRPSADTVTLADVSGASMYGSAPFNGDGVVTAESTGDAETRQALADILTVLPGAADRNGKAGVDMATLQAFQGQAILLLEWQRRADADPSLSSPGIAAAAAALVTVKAKVDDFFTRCRLAAFDSRAADRLNCQEQSFADLADQSLTPASAAIAALPLARVAADGALPLGDGVNPAWQQAVADLDRQAIRPLLGERPLLTEQDWLALQEKLRPYAEWQAARPAVPAAALGAKRLAAWMEAGHGAAIAELIRQDLAVAEEFDQLANIAKLVRFQKNLGELLSNYVNFAQFYGRRTAIFQVGTLYLDARACELCVEVIDAARHAAMAAYAGAYVAYCDITRLGQKRSIAAIFTDGDSVNLMVGRNGVFYDRDGQDWDATITKVLPNAISIREAFWLPYRKFVRLIEEQVAKRAQAAETASTARLAETAVVVAGEKPPPVAPRKLELGTLALIGVAFSGIGVLVSGFLQALFGLGWWLPLGLVGIILLISGPSMLLAWLKLRSRNLGPILDANGWAINTRARVNGPFGAALTRLARLPAGSSRTLADPYMERTRPWQVMLIIFILLLAAGLWLLGSMDRFLPPVLQRRPAASHSPTNTIHVTNTNTTHTGSIEK